MSQEAATDIQLSEFEQDMRAPEWRSFRKIKRIFKELPSVSEESAKGHYRAQFVGPLWLRALAPISLPLIHLGGWCGKRIIGNGHATNLVRRRENAIQEVIPMNVKEDESIIDKKPSLTLTYPSSSPLVLRYFIDELRAVDDNTLLGMTIVDLPLIRRCPLPFVLLRP